MSDPPSVPARSTLSPDYQRDWPAYFDAVKGQPPRDTLLRALKNFEADSPARTGPFIAIDVACGEGRDTRELLRRGWTVIATDSHPEAIERSLARIDPAARARVSATRLPMEQLAVASNLPIAADLINASFALPFCKPDALPALWAWITRTLRPGGRFSGQFFGDRDEWRNIRPASHFSRSRVEQLLAPFDIEWFDEVEKDGDDAMGGTKHHHVFHIVARKA